MAKILCIEDEERLRRDIILELRDAGYDALGAKDGQEGLRLIFEIKPDLVLCDIQMPNVDGWEVLREVKARSEEIGSMTFIFLTAFSDRVDVIAGKTEGADDYVVKPIDYDLLISTVQAHLGKTKRLMAVNESRIQNLRSIIDTDNARLQEKELELEMTLINLVDALSSAIEIRDPYTAGHQKSVAEIAVKIGEAMGMSDFDLCGLEMGGLIHDIGKLSIPAEILTYPGRLSEEQFALVRQHPGVGDKVVSKIVFPWPVAEIIHQHHEWFDGGGYPVGLVGEQITMEARIISIADVYDAMSSHRPYRMALGKEQALEHIRGEGGGHFDPEVLEAALPVLEEL